LLRNEVGIFENWFDYHLSERKIKQGKRQKHILEIKEKNGVSYVSDFSFAPINGGYCYVGVVKIGSFKNTLKKTVEILDVMGAEREFYTSDVQDTYVFIRNGEVFSIPYDLRMSKDLIEVKNRINISNGYQNEFSQISI
jgi:hypothetical protein